MPVKKPPTEPGNDVLRLVFEIAAKLPDAQQWLLAQRMLDTLHEFLQSMRPVYHGEEEFMRALGMSEERIARLLAIPVEPDPSEEYDHADV